MLFPPDHERPDVGHVAPHQARRNGAATPQRFKVGGPVPLELWSFEIPAALALAEQNHVGIGAVDQCVDPSVSGGRYERNLNPVPLPALLPKPLWPCAIGA